jgi:general secretion pathway protein M
VSGLRERIAVWLAGLAPRERLLLGAVAALLAVTLVWLGVALPLAGAVGGASARVASAEQDLVVARRVQAELGALQGRLASVEQRIRQGPRGNLFTTLEQLASQSAVKVESMEPQAAQASEDYRETKVQVVLKQVTLAQLVNFLHKIESASQPLSVKSLRVRTRSDQGGEKKQDLLDVTFTVSSFEPVGPA